MLLCCPVSVPHTTGGLAVLAVVLMGDVAVTVSVSHLPIVLAVVLGPVVTKLSKSNRIWQISVNLFLINTKSDFTVHFNCLTAGT